MNKFTKCFGVVIFLCSSIPVLGQNYIGQAEDINKILENIEAFSGYYKAKNYDALAASYTDEGMILPNGPDIIKGREKIKQRWILPEGVEILEHKITPVEIKIIDDHAYDVGYFHGQTKRNDGSITSWKGKYVIIWKKVEGDWKMYIDIWNNVNE